MNFSPNLNLYEIINNDKLASIFQCSTQGGMRRALKTDSLILVSNHVDSIYDDRWVGEVFHYTGMGLKGNQSLNYKQNKTLNESPTNGVNIYLFEVFKEKEYTYMGEVKLVSQAYQEEQPDEDNNLRKVWVFPLALLDQNSSINPVKHETLEQLYEKKIKKAKKLSTEELKERAKSLSKRKTGIRNTTVTQHDRSPWVSEYAKRRANGNCQLCLEPAPFENKKGEPYLETHHIEWLAKGGQDTIENTVALCPNCHRRMHIIDDSKDKILLQERNTLGSI